MAPSSTALTTKVESGTPYQLNPDQTLKAAKALTKHIQAERKKREAAKPVKDLMKTESDDEEEDDEDQVPVWLILGTKKHIVDKKRLKPGRINLPHSVTEATAASRICLITADPQRLFKDVVAHPSFPKELQSKIGRVIGLEKLKAKYKSYESRRQLAAEYDIFLADERIVTFLPPVLGKAFYQSTSRRPIPVSLTGNTKNPNKKPKHALAPRNPVKTTDVVGTPEAVAHEIEKTLHSALVHLAPATTTAVKVGYASWTPEKLTENIEAVVKALTEKYVPKGWRNVRSFHIKGPNTMSLPLWLADELWEDEEDVLDEKWVAPPKDDSKSKNKKRKAIEDAPAEAIEEKAVAGKEEEPKAAKKVKKAKKEEGGNDLEKEIKLRKEKLKKQKEEAAKQVDDGLKIDAAGEDKKVKKSKKKAAA